MVALVWDETGQRFYENGVDRGVLYINTFGIAWNGLTSVESVRTDEISPIYVDGQKIGNFFSIGDFEANIRAFTYPLEFLPYDGVAQYQGMYIDGQRPKEFSLSYRTKIGNDTEGAGAGYKIHILYNLTAMADNRTYTTESLNPEPMELGWTVTSRPETAPGYRPSAHYVIDSRLWDPTRLKAFEEVLYGTSISPPMLPSFKEFLDILDPRNLLIILDHGNYEWSAIDLSGNYLRAFNDELFEMNAPTVVLVDADTFDVSTYRF